MPSLKYLPLPGEGILKFLRYTAEIFSKCWIGDFLKPQKISALFNNFFYFVSNSKKQCIVLAIFQHFPPWKLQNKSCIKDLKFCEVSENPKFSIFSILKTVECPHLEEVNILDLASPFT
jgi:hypothetical protein